MSVNVSTVRIVKTAGNGVTTAFDFAWKIFAAADLTCYKVSVAGVYTLGVLGVDYTVAFDSDAETGTVTWIVAPVSGGFSVIIGDAIAQTQTAAFPREGVTPAATQKNAYDKSTILLQQLTERVSRAPLQPLTPVNPMAITVDLPVDIKGLRYRLTAGVWHIEPTTYDPDTQQAASAASAAAAAASAAAAAASAAAAGVALPFLSGLYAAQPAAPLVPTGWYSTDRQTLEIYVPAAARWFLIG